MTIETTTKVTTASGAVWLILEGTHITRLADHPIHSASSLRALSEVVECEEILELAPVELGKPLRVRLEKGPITTTTIVKIEHVSEEG